MSGCEPFLRRRRHWPTFQGHLDEVAEMIAVRQFWPSRAVDDEGEVIDLLVQLTREDCRREVRNAPSAGFRPLRLNGAPLRSRRRHPPPDCIRTGDRSAGSALHTSPTGLCDSAEAPSPRPPSARRPARRSSDRRQPRRRPGCRRTQPRAHRGAPAGRPPDAGPTSVAARSCRR